MSVGELSSPLANDIVAFVAFKHALGIGYRREEFTLRAFDRFVAERYPRCVPRARLPDLIRQWMTRKNRKPITLAAEHVVIRQLCLFRRRSDARAFVPPRAWAPASTRSSFVPTVLSKEEVVRVLNAASSLGRPAFRGVLYRTLVLVLYCTGVRFGEALRLRVRDVDIRRRVLWIAPSKGRSRWVPFDESLASELRRYMRARREYGAAWPDDRFFVGNDRKRLCANTASDALRTLFRVVGLKPAEGRVGPRPYDLRHAFAVHRLERWYRAGVDLHERLPWLSAYMGHDNILGTEKYLHATARLLEVAGRRLHRRLTSRRNSR